LEGLLDHLQELSNKNLGTPTALSVKQKKPAFVSQLLPFQRLLPFLITFSVVHENR
jgi:hypothetical protein